MNKTVIITIEPSLGNKVDFKFRSPEIRQLLEQNRITALNTVDYANVWFLEYNITNVLTKAGYEYIYFETNLFGEAKY